MTNITISLLINSASNAIIAVIKPHKMMKFIFGARGNKKWIREPGSLCAPCVWVEAR